MSLYAVEKGMISQYITVSYKKKCVIQFFGLGRGVFRPIFVNMVMNMFVRSSDIRKAVSGC